MPVFESLYAPYIWAVYSLAGLVLGGMILVTAFRARKARRAYEAVVQTRKEPS